MLYYRESENIEDALTAAGAPKSAMELMEVKIVRDMRNKVNRVTNCETANIDKTVTASARQIADIEYLILSLGLEGLPEELREVAVKRMENPELSLRELLGTLSEPLSRSGLNHRLSRLSRMAEELRTRTQTDSTERKVPYGTILCIYTYIRNTACWTAPAGLTGWWKTVKALGQSPHGDHRPWCDVRRDRILSAAKKSGDQADHRL